MRRQLQAKRRGLLGPPTLDESGSPMRSSSIVNDRDTAGWVIPNRAAA
jgi:hypothetical protein